MAQPAQPPDRRNRLDPGAILDAVLRLARQEPGERLTVRRLGQELDADATAVYRHFKNRDAIIRAALDRLFDQSLQRTLAAGPGQHWRTRLETYSSELLKTFLEHPALGRESFATDTYGPGELQSIEFVLQCLTDAGLPPDRVVHYYAALESFNLALGTGISAEVQRLPDSGGHDPWLSPGVFARLSDFPLLERHHAGLGRLDSLMAFDAGLAAILDSAERESQQDVRR
ncbi:TetR/AcrR family transcriptional regulator C-terminal domain-containing protein [Arthrobacter sp. Sa2CUA1]|uniref:TetR/AcrR family transcriptional regulator C-terminal domain-containing protein n=1 Tax=Arthrobacter gallicola TaxID=2762225 RepID=A0ABR8UVP7_9MICC|nr:TetR/AcrR family transcriptional regulator [Arthrobacter gallicola]MBD7996634.1 TetR/AcrR family transcriptional regulator C-terminal domain-containing protein [Arthrobacter gallicola]